MFRFSASPTIIPVMFRFSANLRIMHHPQCHGVEHAPELISRGAWSMSAGW
jgi:hypothetical protein